MQIGEKLSKLLGFEDLENTVTEAVIFVSDVITTTLNMQQ